jgi:hypothetical protein
MSDPQQNPVDFQRYLVNDQYRNASNLDARIAIHQRFSTNN